MGARPYSPTDGRFTQPDPIEGGCANDYMYAFGDPINHPDLTGQGGCKKKKHHWWETAISVAADVGAVGLGIAAIVVTGGAAAAPELALYGAALGGAGALLGLGSAVLSYRDCK